MMAIDYLWRSKNNAAVAQQKNVISAESIAGLLEHADIHAYPSGYLT